MIVVSLVKEQGRERERVEPRERVNTRRSRREFDCCRLSYCRDRFESRFHAALLGIIQSGPGNGRARPDRGGVEGFRGLKAFRKAKRDIRPAPDPLSADSLSEWNPNLEERNWPETGFHLLFPFLFFSLFLSLFSLRSPRSFLHPLSLSLSLSVRPSHASSNISRNFEDRPGSKDETAIIYKVLLSLLLSFALFFSLAFLSSRFHDLSAVPPPRGEILLASECTKDSARLYAEFLLNDDGLRRVALCTERVYN